MGVLGGTEGPPPGCHVVVVSPSKPSSRHSCTQPSVAASRQGRVGWKAMDCTTPRPTGSVSAREPCGEGGRKYVGWGGGDRGVCEWGGGADLHQVPEVDVAILGGAAHVRVLLAQHAVQAVRCAAVPGVPAGWGGRGGVFGGPDPFRGPPTPSTTPQPLP